MRLISRFVQAASLALSLSALLMPARAHGQCSTSSNVTTCTSSSGITVSGLSGTISNISLTMTNLDITNLNSEAMVLVPPSGTPLDLISGVRGAGNAGNREQHIHPGR